MIIYLFQLSVLALAGVDWLRLAWTGLGWLGLAWSDLVWHGLAWSGLGWLGLAWAGFGCLWLAQAGLGWLGRARAGLGWLGLVRAGSGRLGLAWELQLFGLDCTFLDIQVHYPKILFWNNVLYLHMTNRRQVAAAYIGQMRAFFGLLDLMTAVLSSYRSASAKVDISGPNMLCACAGFNPPPPHPIEIWTFQDLYK
jgi:hypothetical protein